MLGGIIVARGEAGVSKRTRKLDPLKRSFFILIMVFDFLYTLFLKVRGGKFAIKQLRNSGNFGSERIGA